MASKQWMRCITLVEVDHSTALLGLPESGHVRKALIIFRVSAKDDHFEWEKLVTDLSRRGDHLFRSHPNPLMHQWVGCKKS